MDILKVIQDEFKLKQDQVEKTVALMDEGNTIPFIARYRKEVTGSLDDQVLREMSERLTYLRGLDKRREEILSSIEAQEKLTDELKADILAAKTLTELEDLYRPYKQKRKTRASMAKDKGLEPLALLILEQDRTVSPDTEAEKYIDEEKGVTTVEEAIAGANDIIAEMVSDDAAVRKRLRAFIYRTGILTSKAADEKADTVYKMYYNFSEPVNKITGHRILAIDRGEKENILKVSVQIVPNEAVSMIQTIYVKGESACSRLVADACEDSFTRLIFPSLENEIRNLLTENAAKSAIKVFALNLKQLLMQPPVKGTVTLGLDPGYRTGCKVAVVDDTGKVLDTGVIYPVPPHNKIAEAKRTVEGLIKKHKISTIAIGNGTASHETESFAANLLKETANTETKYMVVSEAGASVYSASKLAAEEFPQYDVSLRSAVSIARRLQDPLAELVKIDPKAIGVGQYQHDMPKKELDEALGGVVENCVNTVGVDLNTASAPLLSRVAGVNSTVAKNIITYREENGAFKDRANLKKVPKLGAKAFEQCAGFLRVLEGKNVLDNTSVHPESYKAAKALLETCGFKLTDVKNGKLEGLDEKVKEIGVSQLAKQLDIGEPTLLDIVKELQKPGRDPRDELPAPLLRSDVMEMKDLKRGMELKGTVRNVIDFGAFVDIGVHEDGLVHISQLCNRYIKHPLEAVSVGDIVTVWVLDVDVQRKRIALTMKGEPKE